MMCRTTADCNWMDRNLLCEEHELDISVSRGIRGRCQCRAGMEWDHNKLECQASLSVGMIVLYSAIAIGLTALAILGVVLWWRGFIYKIRNAMIKYIM